jgi:hypothetical protein
MSNLTRAEKNIWMDQPTYCNLCFTSIFVCYNCEKTTCIFHSNQDKYYQNPNNNVSHILGPRICDICTVNCVKKIKIKTH